MQCDRKARHHVVRSHGHRQLYHFALCKPCTSVFDAEAGIGLDKTFVNVVAWYDNGWVYSNKALKMVRVIAG